MIPVTDETLEEVEADDLDQRLRGRARFLYDRGEIKSPGLMMEAADALDAANARIAELEDKPALLAGGTHQ